MVKVPEKKRSGWQRKLEPRGKKVVFIGYDHDFTYRFYDPSTNDVTVSREVYFDESKFFEFDKNSSSYLAIDDWLDLMASNLEDDESIHKEKQAHLEQEQADQLQREESSQRDHVADAINDTGDVSINQNDISSFLDAQDNFEQEMLAQNSAGPSTSSPIMSNYNLRSRGPPPANAIAEALTVVVDEPTSYSEAVTCSDAQHWKRAMQEEYDSLIANHTWSLVTAPKHCKPVACKWVYKVKTKNGKVERFKARLVAKGFTQKFGIDYTDTFSPVVKMETIRSLLVLGNQFSWQMIQLDVKTAYVAVTILKVGCSNEIDCLV